MCDTVEMLKKTTLLKKDEKNTGNCSSYHQLQQQPKSKQAKKSQYFSMLTLLQLPRKMQKLIRLSKVST